MLKSIFKRAALGFLIGMVIGNLIALLTGTSPQGDVRLFSPALLRIAGDNAVTATVLQSLFSGLYGAICFAGTVIYNAERLPLAAATALHCAMIILSYIPVALLLGWVDNLPQILLIAGIQLVAFFVIWWIIYAIYKKQVKELNDMQNKIRKEKDK